MTGKTRRDFLKLGYFHFTDGFHSAGWRLPQAVSHASIFEAHRQAAAVAQGAAFDVFFLGDSLDTSLGESGSRLRRLDPVAMLSALAATTQGLGLVATMSTTYSAPYIVARQIGSLDQISHGRAGWNVVTSYSAGVSENFNNHALPPHDQRYALAEEFVDVVRGLWDSFEDGAFIRDKASGQFVDPRRVHALHHQGTHYQVRGPIPVPRSPQGQPVLVQAGSSAAGMQLGARVGELIFTRQSTLDGAVAFRRGFHGALADFGRAATDVIVMPGVLPVIGATQAQARALVRQMDEAIDLEHGLFVLGNQLGLDLSHLRFDDELPELRAAANGQRSVEAILAGLRKRGPLTVAAAARYFGGMRGHIELVGDAEQVAQGLIDLFDAGAGDGFNIIPPFMPGGLGDFAEQVVPILRRRGYLPAGYAGETLRENLGLAVPQSRFSR